MGLWPADDRKSFLSNGGKAVHQRNEWGERIGPKGHEWTSETARAAGKKSVEVRRRRRLFNLAAREGWGL